VIRKVTLGPRSRVLEAKEAEQRELGDRVLGGLLPQGELDKVLYPPTPGPANPTSLRGCGCGKWHLAPGEELLIVDGWTHRYSMACYREEDDGTRTYTDFKNYRSLESRVTDLERVVADLVAQKA
jgi:hypothetical protein